MCGGGGGGMAIFVFYHYLSTGICIYLNCFMSDELFYSFNLDERFSE